MIIQITSDRPGFKNFKFSSGLNIVLAERNSKEDIEDHGTRNGAGKSSLIDIIRFLLGGEVRKGRDVLGSEELSNDRFGIEIYLNEQSVWAYRVPSQRNRIEVVCDSYDAFPIQPNVDDDGTRWFSARVWNDVLGQVLFKLPAAEKIESKSNLSNASCLAFFMRRARDGAFANWVQTHQAQSLVKQSVPLFYILGLDYSAPLDYVRLNEAKTAAAELRKAVKQGFLTDIVGNRAALRNDLVRARNKRSRLEDRLAGFNILDFYNEYQLEATELDLSIRESADQNFIDRSLIERCEQAMSNERPPEVPELRELYSEAGIELPDSVKRRFEEVAEFHTAVIRNRKEHLAAEMGAAIDRILVRNAAIEKATERLREIRRLLSGSIALGDFRKSERELTFLNAEIDNLQGKLDLLDQFDQARSDMRSKKLSAERLLRSTLHDQQEVVLEAISIFQEISSHIYSKPAEFDIESTESGPKFAIREPALASEGINSMQIFTFDLMLSCMAAKAGRWPGFLFHDSHLFDGVDGRQIGLAIEIASQKIAELGGQYIVTFNSDDYEKATRESGRSFDRSILSPRLDDTERGGLFGFRFQRDTTLTDSEGDAS